MQILFINILMDGMSPPAVSAIWTFPFTFLTISYLKCPSGPPSQSLGVDPVDHAVMRKPPRKKDEPIIDRRIRFRVLFSATIIVAGTLFIYYFALSDDHMSRRDQTMVGPAILTHTLSGVTVTGSVRSDELYPSSETILRAAR
jgi:Ca2+-transporting ATPase